MPAPVRTSPLGSFDAYVDEATGGPLRGADLDTIQLNIGLTCNLACRHCHVASGPRRREQMTWETGRAILDAARQCEARLLDITGGAPEMNPHFRRLVGEARAQGLDVQVRTNLTIMLQPGYEDLPEFYRDHQVALVASLPCYMEENVNKQRGDGVYWDSVRVLQRLNAVGYGLDEALPLHLVFNPGGPALPPPQADLEAAYHRELEQRFGIRFNSLFTITNMPIGRFLGDLRSAGRDREYMQLLADAFNPSTVEPLMCRHQIHVDWDGNLHDCDFNLALGMGLAEGMPRNIRDFDADALRNRPIRTARHCFGCTAGAGSSCGGSLV